MINPLFSPDSRIVRAERIPCRREGFVVKTVIWFLPVIILSLSSLLGCGKPKDSFKESRRHFQAGLEKFKQQNMAEAILEFQYVLKLDPSFAEPHYYLGRAYQQVGGLDEAVRYYKLHLKLEPDHVDTHLQLAHIYYRKGNDEQALEEGKYLLDILPPGESELVDVHSIVGEIYLKVKRDYDAAAYHYRQVMDYDPQRPSAYLAFAQIYLAKNEVDEAIRMLKQVVALDRGNKIAREYLVDLYRKKGKTSELIALYKEMLENELTKKTTPNKRDIANNYSNLAQIYWKQGKYELAKEYAQKTLQYDLADSEARDILAKGYLQAEQYKEALKELVLLKKQNYNLEETLMLLGLAYRKLKQFRKSIDVYEKLIFVRPDNFEAQYYRTVLCLETQQWDCAIEGGNELLNRFYDFTPAYLFVGRSYIFKGKWEAAVENLELFFKPKNEDEKVYGKQFYEITFPHLLPPKELQQRDRKKQNIEAHYLLGLAFLGEQRLSESMEEFNQANRLMPSLGDVYLNKAVVCHLQGKLDRAVVNCQLAAQQIGTNKKLLHFILANIYTSMGDVVRASKELKLAEDLVYGFSLGKMDITKNVSIQFPNSLGNLNLGIIYLLNGWKNKAKPEFEKVLKANPNNPLAKYLDNEIYRLMNKYYYKSTHLSKVITQIYQD